jgi:hypothetical protein
VNMKPSTLVSSIVLALAFTPLPALAQSCSCAAVPLLGSMELASPNDGQWYLATTYEYHDVSELVAGSESIPDQTGRERTSEAVIFEASRGITNKWSISALLSAVEHNREVNDAKTSSSGIGDGMLMVKYSPKTISLYSDTSLTFGVGARIPVGVDDATSNGVELAEDMQPSTGAFGGIVWAYWARALNESKGARIYASASYSQNGENSRNYAFGEDAILTFGGAYQTLTPWGFSLDLLYRNAARDRRDSVDIPNTGGKWLEIIPAVQYHVTETLALNAAAKIPLARDLHDQLQFTTKFAFRISLSYVFGGA